MKRTKQTEMMVADANEYFRNNRIKDERDGVFNFVCHFLLTHKMYWGFNYFKDGVAGKPQLAGSGDKDKYDYLQIY